MFLRFSNTSKILCLNQTLTEASASEADTFRLQLLWDTEVNLYLGVPRMSQASVTTYIQSLVGNSRAQATQAHGSEGGFAIYRRASREEGFGVPPDSLTLNTTNFNKLTWKSGTHRHHQAILLF